MKERPILFSAPMVRAVLDDSKTQTRRICKPAQCYSMSEVVEVPDPHERGQVYNGSHFGDEEGVVQFASPYGQPGDRLWVRETHWMDQRDPTLAVMNVDGYVVARNGHETGQRSAPANLRLNQFWKQRPSIHMPRWACRAVLGVHSVRVERLQEISEADAIAEGVCELPMAGMPTDNLWAAHATAGCELHAKTARGAFCKLWQSINGPGSWDANPWVWVIGFKRIKGG